MGRNGGVNGISSSVGLAHSKAFFFGYHLRSNVLYAVEFYSVTTPEPHMSAEPV
jgi:hypothetical protein